MGDVIRIPKMQSIVPAASYADGPTGLGEWLATRREETVRQLETWRAPVLPDEVVDMFATIFLIQPEHKLMPFFVWLEDRLRQSHSFHVSD